MIERPDYDPEWVRRWRRAHTRFEALPATASEHERRAVLEAMYRAHDAQFRTVAELADFRFTALRREALRLGYHLAMQPLAPGATDADVEAAWRSARAQLKALGRAAERRPLGMPEGLDAFGLVPRVAFVRQTALVSQTLPSGRSEAWTALIEQGRRSADVCLIQIDGVRGPFDGFADLAAAVYQSFLARLWWRPFGRRPQQVRFYSYVPWGLHETGSEMFHRRHLRWSRGRYSEDAERRLAFETVPELLAQFDPKPDRTHLLIPVAEISES